ncbi:glomulin [Diorhabda sublineata]|uniref:glomulin n=1 Tax=Diorhabda sublineata TaxID=1163346 RepID=UPI0024E05A3D|nr:glomulin [Diorhabda sublineata]
MSGESDSDFVKSVEELLKSGRTLEAISLFHAKEHTTKVKNNSWDLVPVLSKHSVTYTEDGNINAEVFQCCKELLNSIADISNPEEALLQFIEEVEESDNDIKFVMMLDPLRKILMRIPNKKLISIAWGFNAVHNYLKKYPVPESENLEGKEKLLLDNSEETRNINKLYINLVQFYQLLKDMFPVEDKNSEEKKIKLEFLITLLGRPLVYLDIEIFNAIKNRARISSEILVTQVFEICRDPVALLQTKDDNTDCVYKLCDLGLASLYYQVFVEEICINEIPKVYEAIYFCQNSLHLVTILLNTNHQIVIEKGLKLAMKLLQHIRYRKLSYLLLDSEDHKKFFKALFNIIIYNEVVSLRKSGVEVYKTYLLSFENKGFYLLVNNLISDITHSSLRGYTITLYKDLVYREFSTKKHLNEMSCYVKGNKLFTLLKKFCFLDKKEESDLIELSDEIIATLNLLRYLSIRDSSNETKIWDFFPILEESYFQHLRKGIDLSRAHYKLKIEELRLNNSNKPNIDSDVNVIVKGKSLSKLSEEEKMQVLNSSLTVFDILDSLLCRLKECIEVERKVS